MGDRVKFFEDFKVIKSLNIGITSLISNITTRDGSHKGGWSRLLKCQLKNLGYNNVSILDNKDSLSQFDVIIFDLGAEFSGSLNMFGGLDEKVFKRLQQIEAYQGRLFSWKHQLPSVNTLEGRRSNTSSCGAFKQTDTGFLGRVQEKLNQASRFDHAYKSDLLLIGDSHTPSVWDPSFMIERRDGRTLKGMIENYTVRKYLDLFKQSGLEIKHVHIHCGSIDIRHHVCREADPEQVVAGYLISIVNQMHEIGYSEKVTLNHTMGIEDESRELPKTGYFKGTPFYGSWEQRNRCRLIFNEVVDNYCTGCPGWKSLRFPEYFFDESGKLRFEVMEKPQSVHLSPEHYRWDLDKNINRWINEEGR
jgi:hypothetical protein